MSLRRPCACCNLLHRAAWGLCPQCSIHRAAEGQAALAVLTDPTAPPDARIVAAQQLRLVVELFIGDDEHRAWIEAGHDHHVDVFVPEQAPSSCSPGDRRPSRMSAAEMYRGGGLTLRGARRGTRPVPRTPRTPKRSNPAICPGRRVMR